MADRKLPSGKLRDCIIRELANGASRAEILAKHGSAISSAVSDEYSKFGYPITNGRIDLHAWCVHKDGTIWDPDFLEYANIKSKNGIPLEAPRRYEELTGELKKSTWANVWKQILKPRLSRIPEAMKQQIFETLAQSPVAGNCFLNAWAYSQVSGARFTIGKMGWQGQDGIHWEYG